MARPKILKEWIWWTVRILIIATVFTVMVTKARDSGIETGRRIEREAHDCGNSGYIYDVADRNVSPVKFYKLHMVAVPNPYDDSGRYPR